MISMIKRELRFILYFSSPHFFIIGIMSIKSKNMFEVEYSVQLRGIDMDRYGRFPLWWLVGLAAEPRFLPIFDPNFAKSRMQAIHPDMIIVVRSQAMRLLSNIDVPIVTQSCKWPVYIHIQQSLSRIGHSSYEYMYELFLSSSATSIEKNSVPFAEGYCSLVCAAKGKSVPIPDNMKRVGETIIHDRKGSDLLKRAEVMQQLRDDQLLSSKNIFSPPPSPTAVTPNDCILSPADVVPGGLSASWKVTIRPSDEDQYRHLTHYVYLKMASDLLLTFVPEIKSGFFLLQACAVEYLSELTYEYTGSCTLYVKEVFALEEEKKWDEKSRAFSAAFYSGDSKDRPMSRLHCRIRLTFGKGGDIPKMLSKTLGAEKAPTRSRL